MTNEGKSILRWVLVLALCLGALTPLTVHAVGGHGLNQEEAEILQRQLELGTEISDVESEVAQQQSKYDELQAELEKLYEENKAEKREYELLTQRMADAKLALTESQKQSEEAKQNVTDKQAQYEERLIKMFENRNRSSLEVLLQSENVQGFFTNLELIEVIADSDREMLSELRGAAKQAEVSLAMAQVTAIRSEEILNSSAEKLEGLENGIRLREEEFNTVNLNLLNRQGELDMLLAEDYALDGALQDVRDRQAYAQAQAEAEAQAQAEASRQAEEASRQQEEWNSQTEAPVPSWEDDPVPTENPTEPIWTDPPVETEPIWTEAPTEAPAPQQPLMSLFFPNGYSGIVTSPYGVRWGSFHTGVDFQGAFGSSIMAAASGTVTLASNPLEGQEWGGSGYGNYIIIDHGNGVSTLYGHLMNVQVGVGQYVSAGQQIGLCGSTGWSTGPHLHFEVRVNGVHTDPMPYLW